ncbi:MAG: hypothetical protein KJ737_22045 [Proteobacteria bacterium]|nr:hypothetical protein [Pseudomonadota bacterium]
MIDYKRAFNFWGTMFFKMAEEKNRSWNKETFNEWFYTLPSRIQFENENDKKLFMCLLIDTFSHMINVCAKGNLGNPDS